MHLMKGALVAALATVAAAPVDAAYLTVADWYNGAVIPTVLSGGSLASMPSHAVVVTDAYGTYTAATQHYPVHVGYSGYPYTDPLAISGGRSYFPVSDGSSGQLSGSFGCYSPVGPGCLGAHTVTYTLPFEITGIGGYLSASFGTSSSAALDSIPFFEFDAYATNPEGGYKTYEGFWGTTFDPTKTLTVTWKHGLGWGQDDGAYFLLSNLVALKAGDMVPVPEPASLALFGMGLAGLVAIRQRRRKPEATTIRGQHLLS